jgi:hypothetical protein
MYATGGIRTHNLSRQTAADLHLRPYGHWDRQWYNTTGIKIASFPLCLLLYCLADCSHFDVTHHTEVLFPPMHLIRLGITEFEHVYNSCVLLV